VLLLELTLLELLEAMLLEVELDAILVELEDER
jgi:hypothetical protein